MKQHHCNKQPDRFTLRPPQGFVSSSLSTFPSKVFHVGSIYQKTYYWTVQFILQIYFLLYHRYWNTHSHNYPKTGPLIIASNHTSMIDPPLLSVVCGKRELRFMAKKQLFQHPWGAFFLQNLGAYPIDRESGGDKKAIVETIRLLKEGNAVVIFPEGTRSPDGHLQEFQQGAMRLALSVPNCLIVPVYISGGFEAFGTGRKFPLPCKISVRIGECLDPSKIGEDNDKKNKAELLGKLLENQLKALEQSARP